MLSCLDLEGTATSGDRWFVDETHVKVPASGGYLYRAVDQHGQVIDVLLSQQRDEGVELRLLQRSCGDQLTTAGTSATKAWPNAGPTTTRQRWSRPTARSAATRSSPA